MLAAVETTILIVEDHPATFLGLRAYIGALAEYEDLGAVTSGEEALVRARELTPQLVCLVWRWQGSWTALRSASGCPRCPTLRAWSSTRARGARHRHAGASGGGARRGGQERASLGVRAGAVARGRREAVHVAVFARAVTVRELTDRQRRVLELMALGLDNREIAERMGLGTETIKTHVRAVLKKLEANDRTHAVAIGLRARFIE